MRFRLYLIVGLLAITSLHALLRGQDLDWGGPIDPLQEQLQIHHYELSVTIDPDERYLKGTQKVTFTLPDRDTLRLQLIDRYQVTMVSSEGAALLFSHRDHTLDIAVNSSPHRQSLVIHYEGIPALAENPPWSGGFSWEKDEKGYAWIGFSCQGEGAKIFMPCLDHPSSEPSEGMDLHIIVPAPYYVAANGRLQKMSKEDGFLRYHWATDYPINNYGVNFTIGRMVEIWQPYISISGDTIPMHIYVLAYHQKEGVKLMDVLRESVATHEYYFGPYPFPKDKISIVETPYLGMEHQTINAYGNNFTYQKVGTTSFDWLLHHELGHEWWGNHISVGDWADFWIHEGFDTYGDWLFYLRHGGEDAYIQHVLQQQFLIPHAKPVVGKENATADESYHREVYYKGAYIIHGLRFLLGDKEFFPLLKAIQNHEPFSYTTKANTETLIQFIETQTGRSVRAFMEMYLYTTDIYEFEYRHLKGDEYQIRVTNVEHAVPVEVRTSNGFERIVVRKDPVSVYSKEEIAIDPKAWYLKRVVAK